MCIGCNGVRRPGSARTLGHDAAAFCVGKRTRRTVVGATLHIGCDLRSGDPTPGGLGLQVHRIAMPRCCLRLPPCGIPRATSELQKTRCLVTSRHDDTCHPRINCAQRAPLYLPPSPSLRYLPLSLLRPLSLPLPSLHPSNQDPAPIRNPAPPASLSHSLLALHALRAFSGRY